MSNRRPYPNRFCKNAPAWNLVSCLIVCVALFGSSLVAVAEESQNMTLSLPRQIQSGQDVQISVLFSSRPLPHHFFQLEIDVDGKAAALADLSIGKQTKVDIPPLRPGSHTIRVIWKNAPNRPVVIEKMIDVAGHSSAPSSGVQQ